MHSRRVLSLLGLAFLAAAGCSTTGNDHGADFTSGDHLALSIRHPEARVTGRDADLARAKGKPVVVSQESILDR
jgi:hypothetical protein